MSFAISAVCEIAAYGVAHVVLDRLGRKAPYTFFLFTAGLACFSVTFFGIIFTCS